MFLYRVIEALGRKGVDYAIAGGYAVALHGAVRGTIDLDIVIRLCREDFLAAESCFKGIGLSARLPVDAAQVFDFREEYIRNKNLVAWSFYNPSRPSELVDVIITHDLRKMRIKRIRSDGRVLKVLAVNDLIDMKKASARAQDLEDIRALRELKK